MTDTPPISCEILTQEDEIPAEEFAELYQNGYGSVYSPELGDKKIETATKYILLKDALGNLAALATLNKNHITSGVTRKDSPAGSRIELGLRLLEECRASEGIWASVNLQARHVGMLMARAGMRKIQDEIIIAKLVGMNLDIKEPNLRKLVIPLTHDGSRQLNTDAPIVINFLDSSRPGYAQFIYAWEDKLSNLAG